MKIRYRFLLPLVLGLASANAVFAACDVSVASISGMTAVLKADCATTVNNINWLRDGTTISGGYITVPNGGTASEIHYTTTLASGTHKYSATANDDTIAEGVAATVTVGKQVLTVVSNIGGSVSSTPAGIDNCSSDTCSHEFDAGIPVVLSATADSNGGYVFSGWGGDCNGTNGCAVSMTTPRTVTASFSAQPVAGSCGGANSIATPTPPNTNLCANGTTPSGVSQAGNTYSWTCTGINGSNSVANCSAPQQVPGNCGTADGQTVSSQPSGSAACAAGTVTGMTPGANAYTWTCAGINGAASDQCSANMQQVNGACGSSNGSNFASTPSTNLCNAGTPTSVALSGTTYSWSCNGQAGGTSASCSAGRIVNGACGSSNGGTFTSTPSSGLCSSGTASQVGLSGSTYSWTCSGANTGTPASCSATYNASTGSCAPTPANYSVMDYPNYNSSGSVYITTIAPGSGVALRFTIDKGVYPYGYQLRDENGGTKTYVVSRCPGGTDGPVDGQNGTMSVNGDAKADNCKAMGAYVRYKETSGASPTYYNGLYNMYFTSCFLPTTTAQGSSTPATYYLNITNTGNASVGVQFKNEATLQ